MALSTIPIRQSGNRPNQLLGGDREGVLVVALLASTLLFASFMGQSILAAGFGVVLWFAGLWALRLAGKADPKLRDVYMRSLRYSKYYPARSTPFRINPPSQGKRYQ